MTTFYIFITLIIIICFLLILIIMVQNPKGGGLSSSFGGGAQQMGGVQKTSDFLDKSTWGLATILLILILFSNINLPGLQSNSFEDSKLLDDNNSIEGSFSTEEIPETTIEIPNSSEESSTEN